jgi:FMN-binding domain
MLNSRNKRFLLIVGTTATLASNPLFSNVASAKDTKPAAGPESILGPVVDTRWGPVQVSVVVADHKITGVKVPVYPNHKRRSVQINNRALPLLRQEVVANQSARIDNVSGATVTTIGYSGSLQQAIDSATQKGLL